MSRFRVGRTILGMSAILGFCVLAVAQQGRPPASEPRASINLSADAKAKAAAASDPFAALRQSTSAKAQGALSVEVPGQGASTARFVDTPPQNQLHARTAPADDRSAGREPRYSGELPGAGLPAARRSGGGYAPGSIKLTAIADDSAAAAPPGPFPAAAASEAAQVPQPLPEGTMREIEPRSAAAASDRPAPTTGGVFPGPASTGATDAAWAGGAPSEAAARQGGCGKPGERQLEGPQAPSLSLEKLAPAEVQVGKRTVVELYVRNIGNVAAHNVVVQDEVPAGAQLVGAAPKPSRSDSCRLAWSLGTLKPGEDATIRVELLPLSEGEIGSVASVSFSAEATSRSRATRPELALEVAAPRDVLIGETVVLRMKVTNTGTGVAAGVVLSDVLPPGLAHPAGGELEYEVGDLAPGESRELDLELRAVQAGVAVNQLVARGEGPLQVQRQTQLTVLAPALDVALEGPRRRYLDRQATYTVSVTNPGTAPAHEVELVTYLPPGLDFVEANNSGQFDPATRTVRWLLEELPPQQRGSVTLTALPIEEGQQPLKIAGTARLGLAVEKQETLLVEGVAGILYEVVDLADPIEVGGETVYEIRVVNQGSKTATNVQVVAILPNEMKAVAADGPTRYELAAGQVRFQGLARLAPKADTSYRIRVQGLAPGDTRLRVQLTTDENRTPITKEESTRIYSDQ